MNKKNTASIRLLAMVLSAAMFFSVMPAMAFAEDIASGNPPIITQAPNSGTPQETPSEGNPAHEDSDNGGRQQGKIEADLAGISLMGSAADALTEDYTKNATELVQSLIGNEVTVTDIKSEGTVYRIDNANSQIGITSCVTLDTSGKISSDFTDPDLDALITSEAKDYGGDTAALMFTMQATGSLLNFNYVFASSEFDEDPKYNDIFGLFVKVNDGEFENIALLDNGKHITITNLRAGKSGTQLNNGTSTDIGAAGTAYDYFTVTDSLSINKGECSGFTKKFNAKKSVNIGDIVTIKFVIADVGDEAMNSYVMIEDGSISFEEKGGMISGEITQNNNFVDGASVKLLKGNKQIASAVTAADGKYKFSDVAPGVYTLEVTSENKVITVFVTVDSSAVTKNVTIPNVNGAQNTIVEIFNDETPDVVTDLNDLFDGALANNTDTNKGITQEDLDTVAAGGKVEIKLTAEKKDEIETKGEAEKIKELASTPTAKYLFLDLSVFKTITESGTAKDPVKLIELNDLVDIVIEVPAELRGAGLRVFRVHEGIAQELTATANNDGEKIKLSVDRAYVTITTKKFSTYSMMNVTYNVTINNDAAGASGDGSYAEGAVVNINAGTKSGYSFNGWTSSDGIAFADASSTTTTFTMPANAVTITANWKYIGGIDLGESSDSTDYQYEFWKEVEDKINSAKHSDVISIDANNYDRLSYSVMDALGKNYVTLVINWNGGNTITIPAGKAQINEANRISWSLAMLEQIYKKIEADTSITKNPINPQTGGGDYINDASAGITHGSVAQKSEHIAITSANKEITTSANRNNMIVIVTTIVSLIFWFKCREKKEIK